VVVGSDGTTFYVLTGWATSASVAVVNSHNGRVERTIPVPLDAVSVAPNIQQTTLYVLQSNGTVSAVAMGGGKLEASFRIGRSGVSLALSPDGSTLYVLKRAGNVVNVAVIDVNTESVRRVLPAPDHCLQVLVSPTGTELYQVVGTSGYGNIQVFAV
jgi:DNA-binding beta-propeller fold protein YncE